MKVLFLDYDGTLRVPNTDQVSKESITSLDTIRKRGNLAFINTGRCYYSIGNQVEHLPIDGLICGCGTYIRYHDTVLYEVKANAIQKEKVVHALRQYQVDAFLEGHAGLFMDQRYSDYTNRVVAFFEKQGVYMRPVNADDFEFSKMSLYYKSEEQKRNFEKALQKDFDFITFPNVKAEAVLRHHSKATGMKKILNEKISIPPSLPEDISLILSKTLVKNSLMRMGITDMSASEFLSTFVIEDGEMRNERRSSSNSNPQQLSKSKSGQASKSQSDVNKHLVHLSYKANINSVKKGSKKNLGNLG